MGRGSSRELVYRIASALSDEPQSVQDIATEIDADYTSVKEYLESFAKANIIEATETAGSTRYSLPDHVTGDSDTYFGLPLSETQQERVESLFALIKEQWREKVGGKPSPTQVQKVAVRVLDKHDLDIPYGWYLYGSITVGAYNNDTHYEYSGLPNEDGVEDDVDEAINWASQADDWNEIRLEQYREEDKTLYRVKERIASLFTDYKDLNKNPHQLEEELEEFLTHLPPIDDSETKEIIREFASIAPQLIRDAEKPEQVQQRCILISDAFRDIWDLVALYAFHQDLLEYYDRDRLDTYLMRELADRKEDARKAVSSMADWLPEPEEPDNPYYRQLKEIEADESQQDDSDEESDVFRKFGVE